MRHRTNCCLYSVPFKVYVLGRAYGKQHIYSGLKPMSACSYSVIAVASYKSVNLHLFAQILMHYEAKQVDITSFRPFLWGEAAITAMQTRKLLSNTVHKQLGFEQFVCE